MVRERKLIGRLQAHLQPQGEETVDAIFELAGAPDVSLHQLSIEQDGESSIPAFDRAKRPQAPVAAGNLRSTQNLLDCSGLTDHAQKLIDCRTMLPSGTSACGLASMS